MQARRGTDRHGQEWRGEGRCGTAMQARNGLASRGLERQGIAGGDRHGEEWRSADRRG